jgi:hypothetical protein
MQFMHANSSIRWKTRSCHHIVYCVSNPLPTTSRIILFRNTQPRFTISLCEFFYLRQAYDLIDQMFSAKLLDRFYGMPASRYGYSQAISCKHHSFPLCLIQNEDESEFSWWVIWYFCCLLDLLNILITFRICPICDVLFKGSDTFQLCIYISAHL